ncbi:MAG: antitoxin [Acidimicrobiia bacterium]|nr:antitoxin [Acidimicrobiia bacterium]
MRAARKPGAFDAIADKVESTDYDVEALKARRRGRPAMGSGPADVVPVRIDPELKAAIEASGKERQRAASGVSARRQLPLFAAPCRMLPFAAGSGR